MVTSQMTGRWFYLVTYKFNGVFKQDRYYTLLKTAQMTATSWVNELGGQNNTVDKLFTSSQQRYPSKSPIITQ